MCRSILFFFVGRILCILCVFLISFTYSTVPMFYFYLLFKCPVELQNPLEQRKNTVIFLKSFLSNINDYFVTDIYFHTATKKLLTYMLCCAN